MTITVLIDDLKKAKATHRGLDTRVARQVGYRKVGAFWFGPDNQREEPPFFTKSIDDAKVLIELVAPGSAAAFSFGSEAASATINATQPVFAATPALALCIAALTTICEKT